MSIRDVVLLHGWGFTVRIWDDLAARLAPRFRVHVIDLPGYGAAPPCEPYTLEAMAQAIARAAPRRCNVVGWSLGGAVALEWARRAPRQVLRLALVAATPSFIRRPCWPCATASAVLQEFARAFKEDRAGQFQRFLAAQTKGDARVRQVTRLAQRASATGAADAVLQAGLAVLARTDLRRDLRCIRQPALILHGARDRVVPPGAGRGLAGLLPDARFELMRACAHAPFLTQPARVARLLKEFFDE